MFYSKRSYLTHRNLIFMPEPNKPSTTDSDSQKVEENANDKGQVQPSADDQKTEEEAKPQSGMTIDLKTLTGRDFDSMEDFTKHYKNLTSKIGDQEIAELRKKAEALDELSKVAEKALDEDEDKTSETDKAGTESKTESQAIQEVKILRQEMALNAKYPQSKDVLEDVKAISKITGEDFVVVFERTFKHLVKADEELTKQKDDKVDKTVDSNQRVSTASNMNDAIEKAKKTGDWTPVLKAKGIKVFREK